jgi:phosphoglycolate phosphatase-like HAD superfamily hydrolase
LLKKSGCRRKIIFDMDGVITGEECYWNTAALVVWELLFSKSFLGLTPGKGLPGFKTGVTPREIAAIRQVVFQQEKVLAFFKQKAVNSNWDLAFLTFAYQLMLIFKELALRGIQSEDLIRQLEGERRISLKHLPLISALLSSLGSSWVPSFQSVLDEWTGEARGMDLMKKLPSQLSEEYEGLAQKSFTPRSPLWKGVCDLFQQWYFGEGKYREVYGKELVASGKKGLIFDEEPLLPAKKVRDTLQQLLKKGWILGIATGRPLNELCPLLEHMGIWELFDHESVVTFDDVHKAEEFLGGNQKNVSLGKPHPFSFFKAYWGDKYNSKRLLSGVDLRPEPGKCWVVGDSMADLLAAREMGASFIGVLTGHRWTGIKEDFEKEKASAVLEDITGLPKFFKINN